MEDSFNVILREARQRSGLSISTVAERLRLRADIIRAIEAGDIAKMPPEAYSKNMISAYARILRINGAPLVDDFLSKVNSYSISMAQRAQTQRNSVDSRIVGMSHSYGREKVLFTEEDEDTLAGKYVRPSKMRERVDDETRASQRSRRRSGGISQNEGSSGRYNSNRYSLGRVNMYSGVEEENENMNEAAHASLYSKNRHTRTDYSSSNRGSSSRRESSSSASSRRRSGTMHPHTTRTGNNALFERPNMHGGRGLGVSNGPFSFLSAIPLWMKILAIVLVLVLIVFLVGRCGAANAQDSSSQTTTSTSISGLNDPESSASSTSVSYQAVAPTSSTLSYEVESGKTAYIEVYVDGSATASVAEDITGPASNSFTFSTSIKVVTVQPEYVKLKLDGTEVSFTENDSTGISTYEKKFEEVLAEWNAQQEQKKAEQAAAAAAAAAAKEAASSSSSSDSSGNISVTTK